MGLPRSGKSTFCNKWAENGPKRTIVCSDNIRVALTGKRYEPLAETMVFAIKHVMIRSMLDRGFDVMVDGTHSSDISIQRLFEIDIDAVPIPYFTSPAICKERAINTKQLDLIEPIDRIANNLSKMDLFSRDDLKWENGIELCLKDKNNIFFYYGGCLGVYPKFEQKISQIKKDVIDRNLYGQKNSKSG
jgi:hypothetical protein